MQKKYKFLIHIGTEKTGTKTLQESLFYNRKTFLQDGFYYLRGDNILDSRDLAAACVGDKAQDDFLDKLGIVTPEDRQRYREVLTLSLKEKMAQLPDHVHTVVLSSEHFHSRLREPAMIQYLRTLLEPYAECFQVLCYLRRQVDMVTSAYSTILKGKRAPTFKHVIKTMLRVNSHYCNYDLFLSKWVKVFGLAALRIKLFDRSTLTGGSIVDDFIAEVGIPPSSMVKKIADTNESITPLGQVLLREINAYNQSINVLQTKTKRTLREKLGELILGRHRHLPADEAKRLNKLKVNEHVRREKLRDLIVTNFAGRGQQLPPDEAMRLQALFDPSNEAVRARWFPEREVLFDSAFPEIAPCQLTVEQERIISAMLVFVASCGERRAIAGLSMDE